MYIKKGVDRINIVVRMVVVWIHCSVVTVTLTVVMEQMRLVAPTVSMKK